MDYNLHVPRGRERLICGLNLIYIQNKSLRLTYLQKWPFDQIKNKAFNFDKADFRSQGEILRLPGGTRLKASVLKTDIKE